MLGKSVLLTGGTGFLGSNLIKKLVQENYKVILLIRASTNLWRISDVLDRLSTYVINETDLNKVFQNEQIDFIIHCATNYGKKEVQVSEMLEANLILPLKLLQLGNQYNVTCFINTDTILDKGVSHYSLSKNQFKEWLTVYANEMACINVALEHFYGPNDDQSKFVTHIVHCILNNVDKIDLTLGEQKRDFIYIDDVIDAFLTIIKKSSLSEKGLFNFEIGSTRTISIRDFVVLIKKIAANNHTHLNFGALSYRKNEVMVSDVNISEIKKLGWTPKISLECGLEKMINSEKESVRK